MFAWPLFKMVKTHLQPSLVQVSHALRSKMRRTAAGVVGGCQGQCRTCATWLLDSDRQSSLVYYGHID